MSICRFGKPVRKQGRRNKPNKYYQWLLAVGLWYFARSIFIIGFFVSGSTLLERVLMPINDCWHGRELCS
jgi:hypothetical protein